MKDQLFVLQIQSNAKCFAVFEVLKQLLRVALMIASAIAKRATKGLREGVVLDFFAGLCVASRCGITIPKSLDSIL